MENWMEVTILIIGLFAVAAFNAYLELPFIACFLIGMAYVAVAVAVPVYFAWAD